MRCMRFTLSTSRWRACARRRGSRCPARSGCNGGAMSSRVTGPRRRAPIRLRPRFDLYDEPMARLADLEAYARQTSSALLALAAQILGTGEGIDAVAGPAGVARAFTTLLRAFPQHASRRQLYIPLDVLERHGVEPHDIFARRSPQNLRAAFAELADIARAHLRTANENIPALQQAVLPAFLPIALVRPLLDRLAGRDPFAPAEISPWRRQWLIWRAARNPARIAG